MSLTTFSSFYYGYDITPDNSLIPFNEGGPELIAELAIGSFTLTEFALAIADAMTVVGGQVYTTTVDRATRRITISSVSNFTILAGTGSAVANAPFGLMGFSASNKTGFATYQGESGAGFSYRPQFILQDHIPTSRWRSASSSTVNKTASGRVELIKFGDEQFMQCNMKWITNIQQPSGAPIENNASGVANLVDFLEWCREKKPVEYMANRDAPSTFEKLLLESTTESKDGTAYRIKEYYDQGLPGYFESGQLVFRKVGV
jgi:hypothetical protein